MILYHGTTVNIDRIDLMKSKPNKDFGRAFYLSEDYNQALEMAQFKAEFAELPPVVNVYSFDEKSLVTILAVWNNYQDPRTTTSGERLFL